MKRRDRKILDIINASRAKDEMPPGAQVELEKMGDYLSMKHRDRDTERLLQLVLPFFRKSIFVTQILKGCVIQNAKLRLRNFESDLQSGPESYVKLYFGYPTCLRRKNYKNVTYTFQEFDSFLYLNTWTLVAVDPVEQTVALPDGHIMYLRTNKCMSENTRQAISRLAT